MSSRSKYQFYQEASLSQKLSHKDEIYKKLAGSDREISNSIGFLLVMADHNLIDMNDPSIKLMLDLLDVQRKAAFATSDKTNEITKMGLQMPKGEDIISSFDEEE